MAKGVQLKKVPKSDRKTRSSVSASAKESVLGTQSLTIKESRAVLPPPAAEKKKTKAIVDQKEVAERDEEKKPARKPRKRKTAEKQEEVKISPADSKEKKSEEAAVAETHSAEMEELSAKKSSRKKRKRMSKGGDAKADEETRKVVEPVAEPVAVLEEETGRKKRKRKATEKAKPPTDVDEAEDLSSQTKTQEATEKKKAKKQTPTSNKTPTETKISSKKAKVTSVPQESLEGPSSAADDEGEGAAPDDESVHLHGFSDSEDSSDDDDYPPDADPLELSKLPTIAKDDATVKRKLEKAKRQPTEDRGVIWMSRLPHGFYEDQMRGYFSQFGEVTRLRLSRNKKTGRSKHYAFIEFASSEVAKIVAETMHNYLLMGHILQCKIIPKDEVHPDLWKGANRKWRVVPRDRIARVQHNKSRTPEEQEKAERRLLSRQDAKKRKLQELGIKYDFNAVSYKKPKSTKA